MKKLMTFAAASACAVSFCMSAAAQEAQKQPVEQVEQEEETDKFLEAGFDLDFFTAYVWRNAVMNDEPVLQPCV